ncbi:HNH endonuclease [Rhizobium leguminosarum]|uniref:5-methylcytosine-specific restriction endonuclease McrA n=1 Tax=Rhizobium leguminosarum TaxID=384 RepID=A0A7X0DWM8_RHILE|nr:HNH endonuclease [Rhizobium leguminosarum]MBB6224984.1 5-methylcytosine-specific restriction endonuclease McrA [Rhizobium leguminosarum]
MDNGKLAPELISDDLAALFQSATDANLDWKSTSNSVVDAKSQLKAILFDAQNGKCAYCRRAIRDEPGHYEIDHILPKSQSGENSAHWVLNDRRLRKATSGYAHFAFFAHNLALTCKRCNNKKGTYDSRMNRAIPAEVHYVMDVDYYEWIHIYLHNYADHIQILEGLIYQAVGGSSNGDAVISTCKLDEIAAVEKAAAELKAQSADTISVAIGNLLFQVQIAGWEFVINAVAAQHPGIALSEIESEAEKYKQIYK